MSHATPFHLLSSSGVSFSHARSSTHDLSPFSSFALLLHLQCCCGIIQDAQIISLVLVRTRRVPVQRAALCIRNFPSQYRNHFRGLSGHDAGSFNATVFISMLSGGRAGVSINSPAAANTSLL